MSATFVTSAIKLVPSEGLASSVIAISFYELGGHQAIALSGTFSETLGGARVPFGGLIFRLRSGLIAVKC